MWGKEGGKFMKNIVAIDIGGTYVKHGVINELGEIIKMGERCQVVTT